MSLKIPVLVFLTIVSSAASELRIPVYSECGGVLDTQSGVISHKADEPFLPDERCVWVLRVPNATGYTVNLITAGFPLTNDTNDHQVILKGFDQAQYDTVALKSLGVYDLQGQELLTITFHSGSENESGYHGFSLQYATNYTGYTAYPLSKSSVDILVNSGSASIRHPERGSIDRTDTSTFIFKPQNNVYEPGRNTNLVHVLNSDFTECHGMSGLLFVYYFNQTSPSSDKWQYQKTVCGDADRERFQYDDVMMLVYTTFVSVVTASFQISYQYQN